MKNTASDQLRRQAALSFLLLFGLAIGLWGIQWGLPNQSRLRAFPKRLIPTPQIAEKFTENWQRIYSKIHLSHQEMKAEPSTAIQGVVEIAPNWTFPPDQLLNSYRSLLIQSENPDEKKSFIILSQMHPQKLDFKPLYIEYGGSYIYPLGAFLKAMSLIRLIQLVHDMNHYLLHPQEMGQLYLFGRFFVLLFQLGSLWLLFDIGETISNWETGFFAAVFFCLCPTIIINSHILKPHPYAAFWCFATIRYGLHAQNTGKRKEYILSGLCSGLAMGANLLFGCFTFTPVFVWLMRKLNGKGKYREWVSMILSLIVASGFFLLTNPYLILSPRDFMWEILVLPSYTHSWNLGNLPRLLGPIAAGGMGFFLYAAAATGALLSITKNSNRRLIVGILFIGVISTDLFLSRTSWNSQMNISSLRLFYPLIGLACLLGSDLIMSFPVIPRNLALTIILIDTGMRGGVYLKNMSLDSGIDSTRSEAATWINAHIPSDSQVGLSRYPEPAHTPPFRYDHYHLVIFQNVADLKLPPEYLVIDHAARKNIALWTKKNYALIKSFEPVSIGWATVRDDSFFANTGIYIYKRSGLPEK